MYKELYRYFILNKELHLPGIGKFILLTNPASFDFSGKAIRPPSYTISFQQGVATPSKRFFRWLSNTLQISERDALIRFNDFAFSLKKQLAEKTEINWNGMGKIYEDFEGAIKFTPSSKKIDFGVVTPVEKIIREDVNRILKVGGQEKTSDEIIEIPGYPETKNFYWWTYALIIGLLVVIFTGWYISTYGLKTSSSANQQKIIPADTISTHKDL